MRAAVSDTLQPRLPVQSVREAPIVAPVLARVKSIPPFAYLLKGLIMRALGLVIGALVILVGGIGFAAPDLRLALERPLITPAGLYVVAVLRIALGLALALAAPASRAPRTVRVLGLIVIIAGLAAPWFGAARAQAVLDRIASAGPSLMRVDGSVAMALGGFLVYVFRAPIRRERN